MYINKKFICFFVGIMLSLTMLLPVAFASSEPSYINGKTFSDYCGTEFPETTAGSIAVYNPESGFMIYEKNSDSIIFPASTVKIMTAIVAYESIPDKSVHITVTEKVAKQTAGLRLGLAANEIYTAEDLIRAVLICGSNDAANLLADHVSGGKRDKFIELMNNKAKELGCTSTNFTNVTGLHDPEMTTTVSDLLKIALYAYENDDLTEWSTSAAYSFASVTHPDNYKLRYNRNDFVSRNNSAKYYYKNAFGLNSGSTKEAGNCLGTAAESKGITYVCIVMNSPIIEDDNTNYAYIDAKALLNKCFDSYEIKSVLDTSSPVSEIAVNLSAGTDHIQLFPVSTVSHLLPKELYESDLIFEKNIPAEVQNAPIAAGNEFGEIIIKFKDNYIIGKSRLVSNQSVERSAVLFTIEKIKEFVSGTFFIVTVITAVVLFILYTFLSVRSKRRRYWFK